KLNVSISDSDAMEKFGRSVGMRMAGVCPKVFEGFMTDTKNSSSTVEDDIEVSGSIKSVDVKEMVSLILRDDSGKEHKLLWLHYFNGSDDFVADPKKLVGKKVSATYKIVDVYSYNLKGYI